MGGDKRPITTHRRRTAAHSLSHSSRSGAPKQVRLCMQTEGGHRYATVYSLPLFLCALTIRSRQNTASAASALRTCLTSPCRARSVLRVPARPRSGAQGSRRLSVLTRICDCISAHLCAPSASMQYAWLLWHRQRQALACTATSPMPAV